MRNRAAFLERHFWIAALHVMLLIPVWLHAQDPTKNPTLVSKPAQKSNAAQGSKPVLGPPTVISFEKYQQLHAQKKARSQLIPHAQTAPAHDTLFSSSGFEPLAKQSSS